LNPLYQHRYHYLLLRKLIILISPVELREASLLGPLGLLGHLSDLFTYLPTHEAERLCHCERGLFGDQLSVELGAALGAA
jgi:hypothetical protein